MNNLTKGLTNFLKNKNIVTVGGVILIIAILYWGYNSQISRQVSPIRNIPIAAIEIPPGTEITDDMLTYVDVAPVVMQHGDGVVTSAAGVVGMYSDYNTIIPEGSLFFETVLISEDQLPDSPFTKIKDGDVVSRFNVTTETTYGNAILPGNKIDIYMSAVEPTTQRVVFGKFIENIEVVAVRDSAGNDVFASRDQSRTPSQIIFGLDPIIHDLFEKAKVLRVTMQPVPHGGTVEAIGEPNITSQRLREFIETFSEPTAELFDDFDFDDFGLELDDFNVNPDDGNQGGEDQGLDDFWPE